ncbi:polymerase [Arcobacter sp. CECT 8989]|uniref:O-antigen ligase family protein n=1 Tax=Arcobacter sp. CECT 8989 TaxID=2044509 RepID=UPI00100B2E47|nr:O-antigen ligase family protein [Arcobacter sp. CECT 8989]RXK03770.1 polymerase [Arcobacter sp. CECT 8989]
MTNILRAPSQNTKDKITLWLNHLLVLYAFLIPIHNGAKSSLFFTMLALFIYRRDYWFYLKEAFSNRIVQAFLIFYTLHAIGMIYTDNIDYGKDHMDKIKYLLFPLIFLSFLDIRFAARILIAFIFGMFISEVFSYLIHYQALPYELSIGKYEIWETKAYSPAPFMAHSDHGVGISIVVGLCLYYLLNFKEEKYKRVLAFIVLLISLLNMSFIASRTGYMTLVVVIFITIVITYRENIKLLLSSIILVLIVGFSLYNFSNTINKRINKAINNFEKAIENKKYYENGSTAQRIGLTIYGYEVFKDSPIFGVGTGDHMDLLRAKIPDEEEMLKVIAKPHNVYIQILMQHGLLGALLFIYLIYSILSYKGTSVIKKDVIIILTVTTLVFMLGGLLYGTFELPLIVVLISAMIANKEQNITFNNFDKKIFLKYSAFVILFLIIGITR